MRAGDERNDHKGKIYLLVLPVPEVSSIINGFTVPIAEDLESINFKNLGKSQTARMAIIASIKSISMGVSLLYFPINASLISFWQLTQPQIMNGIKLCFSG